MRKKLKEPILAVGEVTGHAHRLSDNVEVYETEEKTRQFDLETQDMVRHEEHKKIILKPGQYESDKVIEYDHFEEETKKVID